MPHVSVFTPSHDPRWLDDAYESLLDQTFPEWEWVVLLNGGACWPAPDDRRVRVITSDVVAGVGAAKAAAVDECIGNVLVELDHDDVLAPTCLAEVVAAFRLHPEAALVSCDSAQVLEDLCRDQSEFNPAFGWEYYDTKVSALGRLRDVHVHRSMEPTPHNVSYIWYAPNHVRAFPRWAYDAAGGYDRARKICDDADLMCRLYQTGPFCHIDECLYLQRMHPANTQRDPETNAAIQRETVELYDRHIVANALAWTARNHLLALDLGAAHGKPDGWLGVDRVRRPGVDLCCQLPDPLPLADNSCGVIRAADFLEHVADSVALMNELWRLLAPGGLLVTFTPSTDGRGAFQDPTHVSFFNENSFWYYTQANMARFVPEIKARFQVSRLATGYPSDWHRQHQISYVTANLIALKPGTPRHGGLLQW